MTVLALVRGNGLNPVGVSTYKKNPRLDNGGFTIGCNLMSCNLHGIHKRIAVSPAVVAWCVFPPSEENHGRSSLVDMLRQGRGSGRNHLVALPLDAL